MVIWSEESVDEVFLQKQDYHPSDAVLDAGAQSFVVGLNTIYQYSDHLKENGISWTPHMLACDRVFRFGNDQTEDCKTACVVPVNFAGKPDIYMCTYYQDVLHFYSLVL